MCSGLTSFSFQCEDQEENVVLILIRCPEEMFSGSSKIHTGKYYISPSHISYIYVFILTQATDESEASEEEIEQQLRKTDRI